MAVKKTYRINLRNYGSPPAVMVSQYDEGYAIAFEIFDGPLPVLASSLSGYTFKLKGRQPGNPPFLAYEFEGTLATALNAVVSFEIDTTMTGRAGKGTAELVILDEENDVKFASVNFAVYTEPAAVPDGSIDADVQRAMEIAEEVQEIVDTAAAEVKGEAEAWAVGQRDGVDVPSTDPAYENNAKYYAEQAQDIADSIGIDATLSVSGKAADAKKTGDEISSLKEDLNAIQAATTEDVGKALKAKTVSDGKVTEWEFGTVGSGDNATDLIETAPRNLIDVNTFSAGYLNNQTGLVGTSTLSQTTDFIPVEPNQWYTLDNVDRYCVYDENKAYLSIYGSSNYPYYTVSNARYIRVSVPNANINIAVWCKTEEYNATKITGEKPVGLNDTGKEFAPELLTSLSESDNQHFQNGINLIDPISNYVWASNYPHFNASTGLIFTSMLVAKANKEIHAGTATIPDNGSIGVDQYIPVVAGKYLFANFAMWDSPAYDAQKERVAEISSTLEGYEGRLIPEGVAFVRINFKAYANSTNKWFMKSLDDVNKLMVWQEDTAVSIRPPKDMPKKIDGAMVSADFLDKAIPNMADSPFLSAMKCLAIREINKRSHAWRIGNFNAWVNTGTKGFYMIRKMLMDYGVDFCGFEEMSYRKTDLGTFLKSWQFADGFVSPKDSSGGATNSLSLASRFIVQVWNTYTMTSVSSNKDCINARITLPRYMDVYEAFKTLSMYVIHPPITTDATQIAMANELLGIIANDDSDYIVIVSDTNSFASTLEGKKFWTTMIAGGFAPVLPIESKTVTQDNIGSESDEYPDKAWRWHAIDQIFVSSNIECASYNVVNTKDEYGVEGISGNGTNNELALSDHDFVYADLVFKNEQRTIVPVE